MRNKLLALQLFDSVPAMVNHTVPRPKPTRVKEPHPNRGESKPDKNEISWTDHTGVIVNKALHCGISWLQSLWTRRPP